MLRVGWQDKPSHAKLAPPPPTSCQPALVCCTGRGYCFVRVIVSPTPHGLRRGHLSLSSIAGVSFFFAGLRQSLTSHGQRLTVRGLDCLPLTYVRHPARASKGKENVQQRSTPKGSSSIDSVPRLRPLGLKMRLVTRQYVFGMSSIVRGPPRCSRLHICLSLPWSSPQSPCSDLPPPCG
jgi:hypothetical protein